MKHAYFDFTVKNLDEAKLFFERVFNWQFEKFPMPYDYYRIQAGPEDEPGIDGGIGAIADTSGARSRFCRKHGMTEDWEPIVKERKLARRR